ncbi:MAG: hypothetical protein R3212_11535, partial [Xanthomonadales bacterium]|nr:hypothetical protein [Xanthomonadales bacterium]
MKTELLILCIAMIAAPAVSLSEQQSNYDELVREATKERNSDAALQLSRFMYGCAIDAATPDCNRIGHNADEEGLRWLKVAAERGNLEAQLLYASGLPRGTPLNDDTAVEKWLVNA